MSMKTSLMQWGGLLAASAALLSIPVIPAAFADPPTGGSGGGTPTTAINLYPATKHQWGDDEGPLPKVTTKVLVNGKEADEHVKPGDALNYTISAKYEKEYYLTEDQMWNGSFGKPDAREGSSFYRPTLRFHIPATLEKPKLTDIKVDSGQVANRVRDLGNGDYIVYFDYEDAPSDAETIVPALPDDLKTNLETRAKKDPVDGVGCLINANCEEQGHYLANGQTVTVTFSTKVPSTAKDKDNYKVEAQGQAWAFPFTNVKPDTVRFIDLYNIKHESSTSFAGLSTEAKNYIESVVKDQKGYQCNFAAVAKARVLSKGGYGVYPQFFLVGERGVYHPEPAYNGIDENAPEKVDQTVPLSINPNGKIPRFSIQPYQPKSDEDPANDKLILGWTKSGDLTKGTDYQVFNNYDGRNLKFGTNDKSEVYVDPSKDLDYPRLDGAVISSRYSVAFNFNYDPAVYAASKDMKNSAWLHNNDYVELLTFYTNPNCTEMRDKGEMRVGDELGDNNAYGCHAPFPPVQVSTRFAVARYAHPSDTPGAAAIATVDDPQPAAKTYKLGDTVFLDENGNGVMDGAEKGVDGVKVTVTKKGSSDAIPGCKDLITANGGKYECPALVNGDYTVTFTDPDNRDFTKVASAADDKQQVNHVGETKHKEDSGKQVSFGSTDVTIKDADNLTGDAGLVKPTPPGPTPPPTPKKYKLGDTVFLDKNNDGIQQPDAEPGVDGVKVTVTDKNTGKVVPTCEALTTSKGGKYECSGLVNGDYTVTFTDPENRDFTKVASATDDNQQVNHVGKTEHKEDSGKQVSFGSTDVTIKDADNLTADAGLKYVEPTPPPGPTPPPSPVVTKHKLGDTVFLDKNNNGVQDPGEPGVEGVKVTVTDNKTGKTASNCENLTTDKAGWYECAGLVDGEYKVTFTDPKGREFTKVGTGTEDQNVNKVTGKGTGSTIVEIKGKDVLTADAGLKYVEPPVTPSKPPKKPGPEPILAKTGTDALGFGGIALATLFAGAGLMAISRKRKPRHRS